MTRLYRAALATLTGDDMLGRSMLAALFVLFGSLVDVDAQPMRDASRGELLYSTNCIACHSAQVHWRDKNSPLTGRACSQEVAPLARELLRAWVEQWRHCGGCAIPERALLPLSRAGLTGGYRMPIDSALQAWWLEPLSAGTADLPEWPRACQVQRPKHGLPDSVPTCSGRDRIGHCCCSSSPASRIRWSLFSSWPARFPRLPAEVTNFLIITCIVLLSVTLDFVQEYRADEAAEKLRQSVSLRATVVRDGKSLEVAVTEVVPGDIVLLSAGDLIPADGRVLEARDFFVKQALLTGESYPVEKRPARCRSATDLTRPPTRYSWERRSSAAAPMVLDGQDRARTAIGEIADSITRARHRPRSRLGARRFGMLIMRLTILVLFVLLVNACSTGHGWSPSSSPWRWRSVSRRSCCPWWFRSRCRVVRCAWRSST